MFCKMQCLLLFPLHKESGFGGGQKAELEFVLPENL